jgi:hypothetical protein
MRPRNNKTIMSIGINLIYSMMLSDKHMEIELLEFAAKGELAVDHHQ